MLNSSCDMHAEIFRAKCTDICDLPWSASKKRWIDGWMDGLHDKTSATGNVNGRI